MSGSYLDRLQWVKPDAPEVPPTREVDGNEEVETAAVESLPPAETKRARARMFVDRTLQTVGLPIGSTEEARSSPLLEARDLLSAAAEVEHGLLVQYLYASYSCTNAGLRGKVAQIAREEMGHLISVQNLLLAIGCHPHFGRDHFPLAPDSGEVFPFALTFEKLTLDSLAKYVVAESPPLENITDPALRGRVMPVIGLGKGAAHQAINHVGALYIALYWLFAKSDTDMAGWPCYPADMVRDIHLKKLNRPKEWHIQGKDLALWPGLDDLQADNGREDWTRGDEAIFVRTLPAAADGRADRVTMLKTLFDIAEQGEGWEMSADPDQASHFIRFLETFEALRTILATGAAPPVIAVPNNPTTVAPPAPAPVPEDYIGNPEANLWARIFNVRYKVALLKLALAMSSQRSLDAPGKVDGRASLIEDALVEMKSNLKTLALLLVRMRRTGVPADGAQPRRAAPPFELPKGSLPDLAGLDLAASVAVLREALAAALGETADLVNQVNALPPGLLDDPAPSRAFLKDVLVPADEKLRKALAEPRPPIEP